MKYVMLIYESAADVEGRKEPRNEAYVAAWRAYHKALTAAGARMAGGAPLTNARFADRSGWEASGRAGAAFKLAPAVSIRTAAYTGWRLPTLNELYRPFRVGNDITEANPALGLERLRGAEAGAEWRPAPWAEVTASYFRNWLRDAVGNITLTTAAGLYPALNVFVPTGGVLRQRQNVDRIVADGVEEAFGGEPGLLVADEEGEILGHLAAFDGVDDDLFQEQRVIDELLVVVELAAMGEAARPGEDRGDGIRRGRLALLVLAIVARDRAVRGFRFHGLAVRRDQHGGHEAE